MLCRRQTRWWRRWCEIIGVDAGKQYVKDGQAPQDTHVLLKRGRQRAGRREMKHLGLVSRPQNALRQPANPSNYTLTPSARFCPL